MCSMNNRKISLQGKVGDSCKWKLFSADSLIFAVVCLLLISYFAVFIYLNIYKYTQHVDSDIAAEGLLAREIWTEKDFTPDHWIPSTDRRVVGVPTIAAAFYGMTGSMVLSMGLACVMTGGVLLFAIALTLKNCQLSRLGIAAGMLALCALPINGQRNDGQLVPFVMLLWFLFADYYALHSICLFLCIAFYLYLRENADAVSKKEKVCRVFVWLLLFGFCVALSLGGMRCLQIVILPLVIWEILCLFFESGHMAQRLPNDRWVASGFIFSMVIAGVLARIYPGSIDYPLYIQDGRGVIERLTGYVPAAVLECLGIAGNCTLDSFSALLQMGIFAVLFLTGYGFVYLVQKGRIAFCQRALLQILAVSFLLTVFIEIVTTAEPAHNYFFVIWFLIMALLAVQITYYEKKAPHFARLIAVCLCMFAICNFFYTYSDCVTTTDNLEEYEEVAAYIESQGISYGYAEFWDASRISLLTDGRITMGNCCQMSPLQMRWWLTSTKWYVPDLPREMPTAYVVRVQDKEAFEAQFEDASVVVPGFENSRFVVYTSQYNFVSLN